MPPANSYLANEQEVISFVNTQSRESDFESKCKHFYMRSTADVHVSFDRPANSSDMLLKSSDGIVEFICEGTRISAIGDSGSGSLYIMGVR